MIPVLSLDLRCFYLNLLALVRGHFGGTFQSCTLPVLMALYRSSFMIICRT
jgi:hypothetical protein